MPAIDKVTAIATAIAGLVATWVIGGWGGEEVAGTVSMFAVIGFAVFATVCAAMAAAASAGRRRAAWLCLMVGLGGWAFGEVLWAYYDLVLHEDPFPSIADIAYLLYPVGACLALMLSPIGHSGQSQTRILLDGVIVSGALFVISWVTVLRPVYEAGGESRFAVGLALAYPVTDIVVVTVALLVLSRAPAGHRTTLVLLTLGNVLNAVSDSVWLFLDLNDAYRNGSLVDVGYMVGLLFLGLAAVSSLRTASFEQLPARAPSRAEMWLPYVPVGIAAAICTPWLLTVPGIAPLLISSCLLIVAVFARQFMVVGENQRLLAMVADQALRDPLTGLANRALFHDRLTHAVQLHERDNQSVAVLVADLDDFKLVNDSLGHPAGDALLFLVAQRILGCVRASDTVARLGGDEFAVLMEGRADDSRYVAHRVVEAFEAPFRIDGHDLLVRPSVGLAVASADEPGITADALLKQADVAMYSGKRSRVSGVHSFTPDMYLVDPDQIDTARATNGSAGALAVTLLGQLRHAIDHGGLSLVYQPKFDLRDEKFVGVEALVRWPHPERGMLGPNHFLPLVREHGLMRAVTELVLDQALDDVAQWLSMGVAVPVSVNVFAPSLGDLTLPKQIAGALAVRNLGTDMLTIEITEDVLLDDMDRTRTVIDKMRDHGVRVAIDDFGSGYSALSYLHDLPIDELKLDRQFIAPVLVDWRAAAIVRAVIDLAQVLGLGTVGEGVENAVTAARLREYGCEVGQGYYYSPPVDAAGTVALMSTPATASTGAFS